MAQERFQRPSSSTLLHCVQRDESEPRTSKTNASPHQAVLGNPQLRERAPNEVTQGNEIQDLESVKMLQLVIDTVNLH